MVVAFTPSPARMAHLEGIALGNVPFPDRELTFREKSLSDVILRKAKDNENDILERTKKQEQAKMRRENRMKNGRVSTAAFATIANTLADAPARPKRKWI